jgi:HSP20 family protein
MNWTQRPELAVWNPWQEMQRFQGELDQYFHELERPLRAQLFPIEMLAKDDALRVRAEIPGCDPRTIDVSIEGESLKIAFERPAPEVAEGGKMRHSEREFGRFTRTLRLPYMVDADGVRASYDHGILAIDLPRAAEDKPRKIEVRTHSTIEANTSNTVNLPRNGGQS